MVGPYSATGADTIIVLYSPTGWAIGQILHTAVDSHFWLRAIYLLITSIGTTRRRAFHIQPKLLPMRSYGEVGSYNS